MKKVVLIGGGNHAHYCIDILNKMNEYEIIGIIDSKNVLGTNLYGYPVIGRQKNIANLISEYNIDCGLICIGDNWSRQIVCEEILNLVPDFEYINAIHPSAIIGSNVSLGSGIVAMAGVIINPGCKVDSHCFLATGAQLEHDSIMHKYSSLSAGVVTGGRVTIGKGTAVTLGVTILDRLEIGEYSVIGAGSLVLKSVPSYKVAYGTPAQVVRSRTQSDKFLK